MKTGFQRNLFVWVGVVVLCMVIAAGCSALKRRDGTPSGGGKGTSQGGPNPVYLDFDDILIPADLQTDKEMTFVFRIGALTAGVLSLKGRVPPETLIGFFESNMSRDNWSAVSSFRSPRSMLLFEKGTRWCVITITDDDFDHKTRVEIWVSPKSEEVGSGLLN